MSKLPFTGGECELERVRRYEALSKPFRNFAAAIETDLRMYSLSRLSMQTFMQGLTMKPWKEPPFTNFIGITVCPGLMVDTQFVPVENRPDYILK